LHSAEMDCFVHLCGGKTEDEYQLKEKELAARSDELKHEQDNSFKLSKNLEAETKAKNDETAAKNKEETAKKNAITRGHMELMGKKITAVMKDQKSDQINELNDEMQKLHQMIEDERQANAAEKAALMDIQSRLQSDKQGLEQRVRQFQAALAKSGVESLRMCRELSDPNIAPWTEAEKQAGLANIISEDLSQSLRGPAWEGLAPAGKLAAKPQNESAEVKWQQVYDEASARYYYSAVGGSETQWEAPTDGKVLYVWDQVTDASTGKLYYQNKLSQATQWEVPEAGYNAASTAAEAAAPAVTTSPVTTYLTTPMHQACLAGDKKTVKSILRELGEQQKIDECLCAKDGDGRTPLDVCVANSHGELHEYLVSKASVAQGRPNQLPPMDRRISVDSASGGAMPSMGDVGVALPGAVVED